MLARRILVHATAPKMTVYAANEPSPCSTCDHAIGVRSSASKENQKWVGRYGWMTATCETASRISLTITVTRIVAMTAIACWVKVDSASPIAPSADSAAATYRTMSASLASPAPSETVVPDSSVTGPTGKKIAPISNPSPATSTVAVRQNTTIMTYFVTSSLVRPAGTVSNVRSVPIPASPATESPATTDTDSGSSTVSST